MNSPKILIMVLAADVPPHDAMVNEVKSTWGAMSVEGVRTVYYWGRRRSGTRPLDGKTLVEGDDILIDIEETSYAILHKTLLAYRFVAENFGFDHVFRCCSGCYVDVRMFLEFVKGKPKERLWCGVTDTTSFGHPFVSGAGMLLSRDLVEMLAENHKEVLSAPYPGYMDDVSVAWFLTRRGVVPDSAAPRADDTRDPVPGCHHYHFRSNPAFMRALHEKLSKNV